MQTNNFTWTGYNPTKKTHQVLMSFLLLDVQYLPDYAEELKTAIQHYQLKPQTTFDGSGNGYEFECLPEGFYINSLYDGDPLTPITIDYHTVKAALTAWAEYCRQIESSNL